MNVHDITHLLGKEGEVVNRFVTGLYKENKYVIRFASGDTEEFDESELDRRYRKKS